MKTEITGIAAFGGEEYGELRATPKGTAVLNFSVGERDRESGNISQWHSLVAWGPMAEKIQAHVRKGTLVAVTSYGYDVQAWASKNGPAAKAVFTVHEIKQWEGKSKAEGGGFVELRVRGDSPDTMPSDDHFPDEPPPGFIEDDDIPF